MTLQDFILKQVGDRGWSLNELARRAGLSSGSISMVMSEQRRAGPVFCNGIARALKISPEEVFRRAGLLPPAPPENPSIIEVTRLFVKLSPEQREYVLTTMRALRQEQERKAAIGPVAEPAT